MSTLEERKQAYAEKFRGTLWDQVKKYREELKVSPLYYRGSYFDGDETAYTNLQRVHSILANGQEVYWWDVDNVDHYFSDGDLESMMQELVIRGLRVHQISHDVRRYIETVEDPLNFDAVAYYKELLEQEV